MGPLKRHAAKIAVVVCALALLSGGYFWFGGGYDRWSTGRLIEDACDGVLPADEVRAVLGDRGLENGPERDRNEGGLEDKETSLRVECDIQRDVEHNAGKATHDASVEVVISGVPTVNRQDRYDGLYPGVPSSLPPSPLGQGWNGVFSTSDTYDDEAGSTTAVLLDCAKGRSDLLVTVHAEAEDITLDNPDRRTEFARIATATAADASHHWGCDADLGRPLTTAPLPVNEDERVPPAEAKGTCADVPARRKSVSWAWESKTGETPYEECVLGNSRGHTVYVLAAHYGPFAEDARYNQFERPGAPGHSSGSRAGELYGNGYWTSAVCPRHGEPAFFSLRPSGDSKTSAADRAYERSALKVFARRSAKAHGCSAPATP